MGDSLLSPKQKQVLEWIEQYLSQNHTLPSRREIAFGLGLSSPATIQQHIEALEKKGFIKRPEHKEARALQWTAKGKRSQTVRFAQEQRSQTVRFAQEKLLNSKSARTNAHTHINAFTHKSAAYDSHEVEVPLLGTIAAGYPIEVFTDEQTLNVHLSFFKQSALGKIGEVFALKVRGDSMMNEGILNGDVVILRKSDSPRNGDTVAALLNGEATLKTLVKSKGPKGAVIELHPANPKFPVIPIHEEDRFEVQGVVVGLMRKYG